MRPAPTGGGVSGSKSAVTGIGKQLSSLHIITGLTGANDSTQLDAVIGYTSLLGQQEETIKIELGLREPLLTSAVRAEAQTLLRNPISNEPMVPAFLVQCLSREEAMAEKLRAALSSFRPPLGEERQRRIRHLNHPLLFHLENAHLVGASRSGS